MTARICTQPVLNVFLVTLNDTPPNRVFGWRVRVSVSVVTASSHVSALASRGNEMVMVVMRGVMGPHAG